ncbi:MAG: fused MFS/spermidine synthase [Nitrospirota bacterium]|jgi:spermidine synthase
MTSKLRSSIFLVSVYFAFFASGASCLIAEVTWNRMLIVVVGNSLSAAAMIIVVFMGGLGFGSYVGGKVLSKRRVSLLPYIILEVSVGIYVLASPLLFDLLAGVFNSLAGSVDNRNIITMTRIIVSMGALFLPAALMGATFPAMIAGAAPDSPFRRTARTGYLYSVNTLGAALGTYVAGWILLLEFGVRTTLGVAFGLYMLAALSALLGSRALKGIYREAAPEPQPERAAAGVLDVGLWRFLAIATFGIGFVSLAYEVLLTRLIILYLGNTIRVFPLVLAAFLLGIGISAITGTWLYGVLRRKTGRADSLFGIIALGAGAAVFLTPYILLSDLIIGADHFVQFVQATPINPLPVLLIIMAPTILIGSLLPIAIRMLQPEGRGEATKEAATLYALNTAGGLLGAGLANHFLVPHIGTQGVIIILALICAAVGVFNLLYPAVNLMRRTVAAVSVVSLAVVLVVFPPRLMDLYAGKIAESKLAKSVDVIYTYEGRAATVSVLDQVDPKRGTYRDMYLNGIEEASTRFWHTQLFKLLGIFPVLMHESDGPKDALVIAFGAGITAGSVLASDEVASLDVVDLNPDVEGINDLFTEVNGDVFHKPRFHFHNDDGRNYLVTSNKKYDLIISDSTHPRAYDSWILYTKNFYEQVRGHLRPGGIFAQWVPVSRDMRGKLFRIHLNTFRSVFPNSTFWYIYGSDQAFLLATPNPFSLDAQGLQEKLDRLPEWFRAKHYEIDTVARIAGFFWLDGPAMERMIDGETRINIDDRHYIAMQAAVQPLPPKMQLPAYQASIVPYLRNAGRKLVADIRREAAVAQRLANLKFFRSQSDLFNAYCIAPENGNVMYHMDLIFAGNVPEQRPFCRDAQIRHFRRLLGERPDNYLAMSGLAPLLHEAGQADEAMTLAQRAFDLAPQNGKVLDSYGWVMFKEGKYAEALKALEKAKSLLPGNPIVLYHLGAVQLAAGKEGKGREHLEKALSIADDFEGAEHTRELLAEE